MKLPHTEVKFHPEVKFQTGLSSLRVSCKRALRCRRQHHRGGIADLPLLRTLLAICQRSQEPTFWEVMDSSHTFNFKQA